MPKIIDATTAAAQVVVNITRQNINQAIVAKGNLAETITIESQDPDGSWRQIVTDDSGPLQLTATNMQIGIFAAVGQIRINKPITASQVEVWLGA